MGWMLSGYGRRSGRTRVAGGLVLLLIALAAPQAATAAPGDLDASFDVDGLLTTDLSTGGDSAQAVAVQSDGKLVVAGGSNGGDSTVVRYDIDGTLDATFSGDGVVTTDLSGATASDVAIQNDGKIVVSSRWLGVGPDGDFTVARYNTDGSLDSSFSGDGIATTDFGGGDRASGLSLQPDGKIVVAGSRVVGGAFGGLSDFAVARYNIDGSPDSTFAGDGMQTISFANESLGEAQATDVAVQGDGRLVIVGLARQPSFVSGRFGLVRLHADGLPDSTFSGDGKTTTPIIGDGAQAVAIQPDNKLVVAGDDANLEDFAVARHAPDGSLDSSFSGDGVATADLGGWDIGHDLAVQSDGRIVVVGWTSDFALARFNPNGALDSTFSSDGRQVVDFVGSSEAHSVALQADGAIVAAGEHKPEPFDTDTDFALIRIQGGGPPVDVIPPNTTITSGPAGVISTQTPTFGFISSEAGSSFACRIGGGPFTACTSPYTAAALGEGSHVFEVRAIDASGNVDPTPAVRSLTVDLPDAQPPLPPVPPSGTPPGIQTPQPPPAVIAAPSMTDVRLSRKTIQAGQRVTLTFRLSAASQVTVKITKRKGGVRKGKHCRKPGKSPAGKRCDLQVASLSRSLDAGVHQLKLPKLKTGRYRVMAKANTTTSTPLLVRRSRG